VINSYGVFADEPVRVEVVRNSVDGPDIVLNSRGAPNVILAACKELVVISGALVELIVTVEKETVVDVLKNRTELLV
jgi:hypothetical protein